MIDLSMLRHDPEILRASQRARGNDPQIVEDAITADAQWRQAQAEYESLRANQNLFNAKVKAADPAVRAELIAQVKELAQQVKGAQQRAAQAQQRAAQAAERIENVVLADVPAGDESNFVTLRTHGEKPQFDFEIRDHLELGEMLGAIDMQRGAKVSGARFYFLRGVGALLELAIMNLGLQKALAAGFIPVITPTLVKPEIMHGTGFLGEHAAEVYHLQQQDMYLTGTSEVALAGFHADEIIDLQGGSIRYAGWSTCYRSEAGSHGKDTRGIIRVHQFNKLEMFVYATPENAAVEHEQLVQMQEQMLQELGLSYRVVDVAAGDLGSSAARKFDIEAWIPTQNTYRELTSTSNCTSYQARRLGTRFRNENGKTSVAATVNGTLATTRWLTAILETHQQADGSVTVPEALRPFMGGLRVLTPTAAK
ncbi:serine--tRNA ligase [Canibacter sp. lx-72]|uniref:serine--tRNA ligase n=1 Tax=Canibacter zhuwentaonis TaxID=2837491 RepID=UPI001BDD1EF4|nr:serine--tRNA ligase [Canibacter zhuwentaonis]MBT1018638.1 serine--tRNA ligase [Canibacter zhuwentaonis]